jgi:hypothetical protein
MYKRYKQIAVLALAFAVAACSDTLSVGEAAFDADLTSQDLAAVDSLFETEAFKSLKALGGQFNIAGPPAMASAELLRAAAHPSEPGNTARIEAAARQIQMAMAANAAVELIPQQYRGLVLKFVPGEGYVVDEALTGPSNGIRFLLYAVNPVTGEIAEPLNEIGYADLLDESTDQTAAVRLVVVSGEVTFINYLVSANGPPTAPSFSIAGFVTDGEVTVDFDLTVAMQANIGGTSIDIDYAIDVADRDFHVVLDLSIGASEGSSSTSLDISISHGRNTVRVAGELTDEMGTVQVFGNGELFATITFTETSLTVVNPNGDPLSDREEQVLREIMDFVDEVFDVWEDLFNPVEFLFSF